MGYKLGRCDKTLVQRIEKAVKAQNLPYKISGYSVDDVYEAMKHDKKRSGKSKRFVIPIEPGHAEIVKVSDEHIIREAIARVLAN